jgi:ribosomal-protein-alanine N-acetyltransferase
VRAVPVPNPRLADGSVRLRPWVPDDAPALRPACGDASICAFSTVPWRYPPDAAGAWIDRQEKKRQDGRGLTLAVVPDDSPTPVGTVLLTALEWDRRTARFGYWAIGAARGRSYVSRSGRLLLDWALHDLGLLRVELVILPENVRSRHVATAVGATCEGLREGYLPHHGERLDAYVYAVVR